MSLLGARLLRARLLGRPLRLLCPRLLLRRTLLLCLRGTLRLLRRVVLRGGWSALDLGARCRILRRPCHILATLGVTARSRSLSLSFGRRPLTFRPRCRMLALRCRT